MLKIGLDIGSTTAKGVVLDEAGRILFSKYKRHNARAKEAIVEFLLDVCQQCGDEPSVLRITGSVGMGVSERCALPFVQEVVAAARAIRQDYPSVRSMIDIGGEDAKVVFFRDGEATDLRMNGNCAGGTGAFIDQMAIILGVDVDELNRLALQADQVYPIASRCGVFCKTDIQNLIAKNVSRANVAASIFHAVAVQTIVTLAHGCDIETPLLFCGGPLSFIPALRKAFCEYLALDESAIIQPENGTLLPATGAAWTDLEEGEAPIRLSELIARIQTRMSSVSVVSGLAPIFENAEAYAAWKKRMSGMELKRFPLQAGVQEVFLGIDSGSTTTKIVLLDHQSRLLYSYYNINGGNPIQAVEEGLKALQTECERKGAYLFVKGSCSTGYGEDLIKAAFQLNNGIIETIAHYRAAQYLDRAVSFILDIGGQDMKAIFVDQGVIDRIEINEACSSGCGSFIETFAKSLGYTAHEFAELACQSQHPCDLGTRCTVFMNSKVKQVLREGATVNDMAAGLAYSVVKNCLYKVLKLKNTEELGTHIVVQGGTMRNDAVVRAIEQLTGAEVSRCDHPELMGAFGCALYAMEHAAKEAVPLVDMIQKADYTSRLVHCKGCDNQCMVVRYQFANGKLYFSGNRCERVFTNGEKSLQKGVNAYREKNELLFHRTSSAAASTKLRMGIPRCLNMYEDYPFWHTLFTECGMEVCLSGVSNFGNYERSARMVMSDNICFPAKLVHSHIQDLVEKRVDRIFMPFVVYERKEAKNLNSYNCPVVTGYSEVVKNVQIKDTPFDSPVISFKEKKALFKQCMEYLQGLGIGKDTIRKAFVRAEEEQNQYERAMVQRCRNIYGAAVEAGRPVILLAGRPYHSDPLIQHKVGDMIADMGMDVITEDIARYDAYATTDVHFVDQWAYPNQILRAAQWCIAQGREVQFVWMTSFGCGPDAFLMDEIRDLLLRHHRTLTILKLDDINNVGSMKLRVRSLVESLKLAPAEESAGPEKAFVQVPPFDERYRHRKILIPFFTPFLSPLLPAILHVAGYEGENLPLSDLSSCDWGLKYANNEICYPATLIVGDIIKAFKSGRYDPNQVAIAITQTGGQCRATNYYTLIQKALVDAGYTDVPVISISLSDQLRNYQPAFRANWMKLMPLALHLVLYSDCMAKFYYASVVRERERGRAAALRDKYLQAGAIAVANQRADQLIALLRQAADEFDRICEDRMLPKVGIVGEIYLKFNPFAQKHVTDWFIGQGVEVVPPIMSSFFLQNFVNRQTNTQSHLREKNWTDLLALPVYQLVKRQIRKVNRIASRFRYFMPFHDIFEEAEQARAVVSLHAQFGEGWLLPAEIVSYARQGVHHVVSLQPFGCIANHIVAKGVEKRIKRLYPEMNLLSLDFDSGVSEVNITNRLLLFLDRVRAEVAW